MCDNRVEVGINGRVVVDFSLPCGEFWGTRIILCGECRYRAGDFAEELIAQPCYPIVGETGDTVYMPDGQGGNIKARVLSVETCPAIGPLYRVSREDGWIHYAHYWNVRDYPW